MTKRIVGFFLDRALKNNFNASIKRTTKIKYMGCYYDDYGIEYYKEGFGSCDNRKTVWISEEAKKIFPRG